METIIIFGATGTVGAYAALHFKALGYNVIAIGKRSSDGGFFEKYFIKYFSCDISQKKSFDKLPKKIDVIFHFAGMMPAKMSGYEENIYVDSIINGTINILNYGIKSGMRKIVFSQSISDILYLFGSKFPISADVEMKFPLIGDHSMYSICKNTSVNIIQHYAATYNFSHYILRFPTIYAYRESPYYYVNGKKKILGYRKLIDDAQNSRDINVWGNPLLEKDMVYVKDLLSILEGVIDTRFDGGIYNVGSGCGTSLDSFIDAIIEVFSPVDKKSRKIYLKDKSSSPQFILDISKTVKELNYAPQYLTPKLWLEDFKLEMNLNTFFMLNRCINE